jgi:uncharacterized protein YidB (DUF937 family)
MSFLDEIGKQLGAAVQGSGADSGVLHVIRALMSQEGGLDRLLTRFRQGGLETAVQSWLGTGANLPVSAEQIAQLLGSTQLAAIARQIGLDPQQVSSGIPQHLPGLVDRLSPEGRLQSDRSDLLAQRASLLGSLLR